MTIDRLPTGNTSLAAQAFPIICGFLDQLHSERRFVRARFYLDASPEPVRSQLREPTWYEPRSFGTFIATERWGPLVQKRALLRIEIDRLGLRPLALRRFFREFGLGQSGIRVNIHFVAGVVRYAGVLLADDTRAYSSHTDPDRVAKACACARTIIRTSWLA